MKIFLEMQDFKKFPSFSFGCPAKMGVGGRGEDVVFRKEESGKELIPGSHLCTESKLLTLTPAHTLAKGGMGCSGLSSVRGDLGNWQSVRLNQ